ncbi:site-specific DNA-methyltransferase [Candidatus Woesearchaeota archaeon]|nr:site-specific DNA-methyltransferase [Candidatus Woesearchaeota archaeon]
MEQVELPPWKNTSHNMGRSIYRLCGYMAMFPPNVPNHFIKKYSKKGDVVFDPFSGRGTTAIEACFEGRIGIGNDKNPLAYVLTKAQTSVPSYKRIIKRIQDLEKDFLSWNDTKKAEPWEIEMIFHPHTLSHLRFLKTSLNWKSSSVDNFIMAMLLGILHGRSEGYLSLPMPNTFSYSPNYIKGFVEKHNLIRPNRDAFELLRRKLQRCYDKPINKGKAYIGDARKTSKIKDSSVDLIITSPPYTRLITYAKFNWIRLWALGYDAKLLEKKLFTTSSQLKYYDFMKEVLRNCQRVLKKEAKLVLVIGDVQQKDKSKIVNLAEEVWMNCAQPLGFVKVEETIADPISDDRKVTKMWGKTRGNATKIDRILVMKQKSIQ